MSLLKSALFIFLFISISCINKTENCRLFYNNYVYNFGKIKYKSKAMSYFSYRNNCKGSLSINFVRVSCSCLSSNWSEKKIEPNDYGIITIQKDTGILGVFEDKIFVYYNELSLPDTLIIKGEVIYF